MAFRKMLAKRLFDGGKVASPSITVAYSPIPSATFQTVVPLNSTKTNIHREYVTSPESAEKGFLRRFLFRESQKQCLTFSVGEELREKLREFDMNGNRLRFNDLKPPSPDQKLFGSQNGLSVNDAKKILRISQVEMLKAKLREIPKSSISYSEFFNICVEHCRNEDQGYEYAKMLDEYGNVIVLGNVVFLQPEQVAKSMETFIFETIAIPNDPRREELEQLEKHKAIIDQKAKTLVRGELYSGLGFLLFQTFAAIRLTFWDLSWDVMEPICFFVGSLHFALAYAFFLRTSTEPSFQSYFQRRFTVKQKRLMEVHSFDANKYTQLRKVFYPNSSNLKNSHQFSPLIDSVKHQSFKSKARNTPSNLKTISNAKFVERQA